jgi:MbtH protein
MSNPFDDEGGMFFVLKNSEGQHSLWPQPIDVPDGWSVVSGPATRADCIAYVDQNWTDLRPESLIRWMDQESRAQAPDSSAPGTSRSM